MKIRIIIFFIVFVLLLQFYVLSDRSWKAWSLPLSGKVIILDPGHGGPDGERLKETFWRKKSRYMWR